MIGPELWDPQFWAAFWPNILATFAGVGLALWLNRRRERAARRAEETDLLRALRDDLLINLASLAALRKILAEKKIPTQLIGATFVEAILPRLAQVTSDTALTTTVAILQHQLHHLNRRLDHFVDMAHHPLNPQDVISDVVEAERLGRMANSIAPIVPGIESLIRDGLLPRLNARLGIEGTSPTSVRIKHVGEGDAKLTVSGSAASPNANETKAH